MPTYRVGPVLDARLLTGATHGPLACEQAPCHRHHRPAWKPRLAEAAGDDRRSRGARNDQLSPGGVKPMATYRTDPVAAPAASPARRLVCEQCGEVMNDVYSAASWAYVSASRA